jgi:hypothetical protein
MRAERIRSRLYPKAALDLVAEEEGLEPPLVSGR